MCQPIIIVHIYLVSTYNIILGIIKKQQQQQQNNNNAVIIQQHETKYSILHYALMFVCLLSLLGLILDCAHAIVFSLRDYRAEQQPSNTRSSDPVLFEEG